MKPIKHKWRIFLNLSIIVATLYDLISNYDGIDIWLIVWSIFVILLTYDTVRFLQGKPGIQ